MWRTPTNMNFQDFCHALHTTLQVCNNFQCLSYSWSSEAFYHVGKAGLSHFCLLILIFTFSEIKAMTCFLSFLKKTPNRQKKTPTYQTKPPWTNWKSLTWCDKKHFAYFVKSGLKYLLTKGFFITLWAQFHKSYRFPDDVSEENETGVWNHFFLATLAFYLVHTLFHVINKMIWMLAPKSKRLDRKIHLHWEANVLALIFVKRLKNTLQLLGKNTEFFSLVLLKYH